MKGKDLHPRLLYPAKLSFRMEGQIKCFPDKVKLKSSSSPNPYYMKCEKDLSKKSKLKNMNSKMTANSQLLTTTPKQKQEQTNQTTRTGTEPQKWRSHGGLSAGEWAGERGERYRE